MPQSKLTVGQYSILLLDIYMYIDNEPAGLTIHPPPLKQSRVGSFFSHRCLVLPKFFPKRKSGFYRRY